MLPNMPGQLFSLKGIVGYTMVQQKLYNTPLLKSVDYSMEVNWTRQPYKGSLCYQYGCEETFYLEDTGITLQSDHLPLKEIVV